MRNLYTCDNCLFNPAQYQDIGTKVGFCVKYGSLLKNPSHTTCRFFKRQDLPFFIAEEGHAEHYREFADTKGIVFYATKNVEPFKNYSQHHAWLTHTFDPYLHEVAIYQKAEKKWMYLEAFSASRNPIKSIIYSSLIRTYLAQYGSQHDNYRMLLCLSADLGEKIVLQQQDFRVEITNAEFETLQETYLKDIVLMKLYAIQEYGAIIQDEAIMWILDELNGALLSSWKEFFGSVQQLVPIIQTYIIASATKRKTFFPQPCDEEGQTVDTLAAEMAIAIAK